MPRPLWSGSISFGLVHVPVRMYSAVREHKLHFHFVHEKDSSPIGYQKVCKAEGKPVPDDEVVKAFEYTKGKYVFMDDEDFEQAQVEGYKAIDVTDFVPAEEIDPIYFAKTYFLGPGDGAEKVYSLLVQALEDTDLVAIAKFVMRERQHLGALRVRDGVLTLEQLYFADEIQPVDEIKPSKQRIGKEELAMARQLVESGTTAWKPERYKDTYQAELKAAIEAKRKGKEVHRAAEIDEDEEPIDLMEALRASVQQAKRGRTRKAARDGSRASRSRATSSSRRSRGSGRAAR
jgi:DNA end-binding protein Ku